MGLWIDQLYHGSIGIFSSHGVIYRAIDAVTLAVSATMTHEAVAAFK